jgi:hypothetical protein
MKGVVTMKAVIALVLILGVATTTPTGAQTPAATAQQKAATVPPPPATKMEAFEPSAGSVMTLGYDDVGSIQGIAVDAREMRDTKSTGVRGLLVEITESQYREERSFVDTDEIPELLKGFDALLSVQSNPTQFKNFEVRYKTKGGLQLTAFNMTNGTILYAVQVGRTLTAQRTGLSQANMQKVRDLFVAAAQKLNVPPK